MSREERRAYQRQMKSYEKGPALPPAARARAERNAARREARRSESAAPGQITRRFLVLSVVIAAAIGYAAFSVQWPNMPLAAYLGVGAGALALAIPIGIRLLQRRAAQH